MVAMPVRVKPPPADIGEIISPGCASFEITTPANGARTCRSSKSMLPHRETALRDLHLRLRRRQARGERVRFRLRRVERRLADELLL